MSRLFTYCILLLGLRFLLRLIAANPNSPFARLIYNVTAPFLFPFEALTATPSAGAVVVEIPTLIAIPVYLALGWVVVRLMWVLSSRPSARESTTYERDDYY